MQSINFTSLGLDKPAGYREKIMDHKTYRRAQQQNKALIITALVLAAAFAAGYVLLFAAVASELR